MDQSKGFLGTLFDLSFSEFVTTKIIKLLFILAILLAGIMTIVAITTGFTRGAGLGILALILSPVVFLLYVLGARVYLELIIVVFRIAENTNKMVPEEPRNPVAGDPPPSE